MTWEKVVGKKGASMVILLRAFDLLLAAGLIIIMVMFWRNVKDDTFIEKSYIARDVAMLASAAYASPGDLTYCYYEVKGLEFNYELSNSQIAVSDSKGKVNYRYLSDKLKPLGPLIEKFDKEKPFAAFEISKNGGVVDFAARRNGEASPCQT